MVLKEFPTDYIANKYLARYYQMEKQDCEKAKEYCVEALRVSAQEEELLGWMREINHSLMEIYERRVQKGEASEEDVLELGWCYLQNDMGGKGVELLKNREISGKRRAESYNLLSKCYFTQAQYKESIDAGEQGIACSRACEPEDEEEKAKIPGRLAGSYEVISRAWQMLAKAEGISGEESKEYFDKALKAMDLALEQEPENRNYRIEKTQLHLDRGENEKAIDVCDQLLEADGQDFYACVLRQKACFEMHNGQGVVDSFYRAKDIYAVYPPIYELACEVFLKYNQPEDARGILKQAEEAQVSSPKLDLLRLTIMREGAQNDEETQAAYDEALRLYQKFKEQGDEISKDNWAELAYNTARCCRDLGRQQAALKYIEEALSIKKKEPLYLWIRANTLSDLNELKWAMKDYLRCEKAYGDNELVYENMARCYEKLGKYEKAVEYLKKVLSVNEENMRANSRIVDIYTDRLKASGNREYFEKALPHATRQLELAPTAYYYIERGLLYLEAGVWDKAIEDFQEAARLEPENTYAYNNWGCVYRYIGEYEKAVELLKKSVEVMKDNETLTPYFNMGNCYECMIDYVKAVEWYKKGSELFPKNRGIKEDLLRVYKKMRRTDEALDLVEELYTAGSAKKYIEAGIIYKERGQYVRAMRMFKEAKKAGGMDAQAYNQMGYLYLYYKSKPRKALSMFQKALFFWI